MQLDVPDTNTLFECDDGGYSQIVAGEVIRCTVTPMAYSGQIWARTEIWEFSSEDGTGSGSVGTFSEITSRDEIGTNLFIVEYTAPQEIGKTITLKAGIGNVKLVAAFLIRVSSFCP